MSDPKPGIAARREDICPWCRKPIAVNDRIAFHRGRPVHTDCALRGAE